MAQVKKIIVIVSLIIALVLIGLSTFNLLSWWITGGVLITPLIILMTWKSFIKFIKCTVEREKSGEVRKIYFLDMGKCFFFNIPGLVSLAAGITAMTFDPTGTGTITVACTTGMILSIALGLLVVLTDPDAIKVIFWTSIIALISMSLYLIEIKFGTYFAPYRWTYNLISYLDVRATGHTDLVISAIFLSLGIGSFIRSSCKGRHILDTTGSPFIQDIEFLKGINTRQLFLSSISIEKSDLFELLFGGCVNLKVEFKDGTVKTYRVFWGYLVLNLILSAISKPNNADPTN